MGKPFGREQVVDSLNGYAESCWHSLLRLRAAIKDFTEPIVFSSLRFGANTAVCINSILAPEKDSITAIVVIDEEKADINSKNADAIFVLKDLIEVTEGETDDLTEQINRLIKIYVPYCFAPLYARRQKKAFAVSHLAQSLDSRIATLSGDSKWISSPDNLTHVHRMRALCDGVLIGGRTFQRDHPQLTVRRVQGRNPLRILIGSEISPSDGLLDASPDPVIVIGKSQKIDLPDVEYIEMTYKDGLIPTTDILEELYRRGVYSVFIEGGSITSSLFLKENNVDVIQLYISPMMIGEGVDSFLLPPVETIADAYSFKTWRYVLQDEGVLFIGAIAPIG
jgi:diaminohydroxyphosphoribosylaminopyrimidine deaminase/5-amino-6-(5-phosphoribosylamino)uracil reductase